MLNAPEPADVADNKLLFDSCVASATLTSKIAKKACTHNAAGEHVELAGTMGEVPAVAILEVMAGESVDVECAFS